MNQAKKRVCAAALAAALVLCGCAGETGGRAAHMDLTVWTYYNGEQLSAFNALVKQFNKTAGRDAGITVKSVSQGNVNDLAANVLSAFRGEAGAEKVPNIFAAYSDTAYALDQIGGAADLSPYLTEDELGEYVDSYAEEGRFGGGFKIFPVAKSVEILVLNRTDWDKFAAATGAELDGLSTVEGLTETAGRYYAWTDSLTPTPNDGRALFGRDAMANYFLGGALQLGTEIFSLRDGALDLHFDKAVVRKLWDNYYVPYVKGWFASSGRFRSDDLKTGNVIAYVGASSCASFLPDQVFLSQTQRYPIENQILPCPRFAGGAPCAIQQGAGMVVTNTDAAHIRASVEFLKWLTDREQNTAFAVESGYLPVKKDANDLGAVLESTSNVSPTMEQVLQTAFAAVNANRLYTPPPFAGGSEARNILEYSMSDLAQADRETVRARLDEGQSPDQAAAEFTTDAYFEAWYADTLARLEALH